MREDKKLLVFWSKEAPKPCVNVNQNLYFHNTTGKQYLQMSSELTKFDQILVLDLKDSVLKGVSGDLGILRTPSLGSP